MSTNPYFIDEFVAKHFKNANLVAPTDTEIKKKYNQITSQHPYYPIKLIKDEEQSSSITIKTSHSTLVDFVVRSMNTNIDQSMFKFGKYVVICYCFI